MVLIYLIVPLMAQVLPGVCQSICRGDRECVALSACPSARELRRETGNAGLSAVVRAAIRAQLDAIRCGEDGGGRVCCEKTKEDEEEQDLIDELNRMPLIEVCGRVPIQDNRKIAGGSGEDDPAGSWPWMASVGHRDGGVQGSWVHKCGGTLVTRRHVMTAAHCRISLQLWARIGTPHLYEDEGAFEFLIEYFVDHPKFRDPLAYHDVTLAVLGKPVTFSDLVRPICLPSQVVPRDLNAGKLVTLTGWGLDATNSFAGPSSHLKRTEIGVFSQSYCNFTYNVGNTSLLARRVQNSVPNLFLDDVLCAGYQVEDTGSCVGDSGGPISHFDSSSGVGRYIQVGIVSSGVSTCGDKNFPGIYARVGAESVLRFVVEETGIDYVTLPVHGSWSEWSSYSGCSRTCGPGVRRRERTCDDPAPRDGGMECLGNLEETRACFHAECPECGLGFNFDWLLNDKDKEEVRFPWVVSYGRFVPESTSKTGRSVTWLHFCTGTLIAPDRVLVAANCVNHNLTFENAIGGFMVQLGSNQIFDGPLDQGEEDKDGAKRPQVIAVKTAWAHPRSRWRSSPYDVAVLALESPADLGSGTVRLACLPGEPSADNAEEHVDEVVLTAGFSQIRPNDRNLTYLMGREVVTARRSCEDIVRTPAIDRSQIFQMVLPQGISDDLICTRTSGVLSNAPGVHAPCTGYAGAPLMRLERADETAGGGAGPRLVQLGVFSGNAAGCSWTAQRYGRPNWSARLAHGPILRFVQEAMTRDAS